MNPNINIKNFRVFDENGASFELAPITILTGCNSSGKSSFVKGLFLLKSFIDQVAKDIEIDKPLNLSNYKLDFSQYPNNLLGKFEKVSHCGSDNKNVTIEYSVYSLMLSKEVYVKLVFAPDTEAELNNAYLESIDVYTDEGVIYSSSNGNPANFNFNIVKEKCYNFLELERLYHEYCSVYSGYDMERRFSKEQYESIRASVVTSHKIYSPKRIADILKYIRYSHSTKPICSNGEIKDISEVIQWSVNNHSLFCIPVIGYLDGISKSDFRTVIENKLFSKYRDEEKVASNKVIDAFLQSSYSRFSDFFKEYEYLFLEHTIADGNNSYFKNIFHNHLHIPSSSSFFIEQDYLEGYYFVAQQVVGKLYRNDTHINGQEDATGDVQKKYEEWKAVPLNFSILYEIVMMWNHSYDSDENNYYILDVDRIYGHSRYRHIMLHWLSTFANRLLLEVIMPSWTTNMTYVGSSRAEVNRIYSLDSKDDFSVLLNKYLESKRAFKKGQIGNRKYKIGTFLNKWVREFELGYRVSFKVDDEGMGVKIILHKSKNDRTGGLLADEGYGITQLISILIQIETAILTSRKIHSNNYWGLDHLDGEKWSDIQYQSHIISIEEPEIHLHPSMQSKLADMFFEAYRLYNIRFVVETHSEYLIRKFQTFVYNSNHKTKRKGPLQSMSNKDISLYYLSKPQMNVDCSEPQVKRIRIKDDGCLDTPFGHGFFDEADNLSLKLFGI